MAPIDEDPLYRELGRFVVQFSDLQRWLEEAIVHAVGGDTRTTRMLIAPKGGMAAGTAAETYRRVLSHAVRARPAANDRVRLISAIADEVDDLTKRRNRLMHDVWSIGTDDEMAENQARFELIRKRAGGGIELEPVSASELEQLATQCMEASLCVLITSLWFGSLPDTLIDEIGIEVGADGRARAVPSWRT